MDASFLIVAGQSNATSAGTLGRVDAPKELLLPSRRLQIWNRQRARFDAYLAGVNSSNDQTGVQPQQWGPEAGFSQRFLARELGSTLFIIKRAKGNSYLSRDNPTPGAVTWSPVERLGYYDQLVDQFRQAEVAWARSGVNPKPLGLFWMQGENDASFESAAGAYKDNLETLIGRLRADLSLPSLKVVIGKVSQKQQKRWRFVSALREAQEAVAAADENVSTLETNSYTFAADDVHFDATSVLKMGSDLFDRLQP